MDDDSILQKFNELKQEHNMAFDLKKRTTADRKSSFKWTQCHRPPADRIWEDAVCHFASIVEISGAHSDVGHITTDFLNGRPNAKFGQMELHKCQTAGTHRDVRDNDIR